MLVEQRLKGDKGKVIMHWNIYNNLVKIHDTILMICMHCAETLVFLRDYLVKASMGTDD